MNLKSASILIYLYVLSYVPSATAWEDCYAYERKGDRTGYSACNSRNTAETERRREWERQEQERKDRASREWSERYETDIFRKKQLELQRQQLEQLKENKQLESQRLELQRRQLDSSRNRDSSRVDSCAKEFKGIDEVAIEIEKLASNALGKQLAANNCGAAKDAAQILLYASMLSVALSNKATGNSTKSAEELQANALLKITPFVDKFSKKCGK